MTTMKYERILLAALLTLTSLGVAHAHFPWLSTNEKGHAAMWFGESTADQTYAMPKKVRGIQLFSEQGKNALITQAVNRDDLTGLESTTPVNPNAELFGTVVYGIYHGTKLSYHVEHLPQTNSDTWPIDPRPKTALQSVIREVDNGSVAVTVLRDGLPISDTEVKLFCENGHEEAARSTDSDGVVTFTADEIEGGLNAVVVGLIDSEAKGQYNGEDYSSTTVFLTATFRMNPHEHDDVSPKKTSIPAVDPDSGVSVGPSPLPDLPEELTSFGAAVACNHLYVYGGHTGAAHSYSKTEQSNRMWCLDLANGSQSQQWTAMPAGPSLQGLALVSHDNRVIRIGGFTAVNESGKNHDLWSQDSVSAYDPVKKTWTDLPSMPGGRSSLDAAVLGDTVFVFGGWKMAGDSDSATWYQSAWSLNLADPNAVWQTTAAPPFKRRAVSVAAFAGKLFVIGGMQETGGPTTRVDIYDPESDSWCLGPPIPGSGMSGFGSSSFATGGALYVTTLDGFVHRLDANCEEWSTTAKSDPARFFHRMLPITEKELLMIGGANMEMGKFTAIHLIRITSSK